MAIEPAAVEPEPMSQEGHEHEWRLVSSESDGTVEVREYLCSGCPAVLITE